jgi:hypothetical protein
MSNSQIPAYMNVLGQLSLEDIYIQQTFDYYRKRYQANGLLHQFVKESPRIPDYLRDHQYIGVCDRTLGTKLPVARTLDGAAIRGALQTLGLINATGSERFRGCIIFPEFDEKRDIVGAVGYRFGERVRHWQQAVIHWEKPAISGFVKEGLTLVREVIYGKAN